MLKAAEGYLRAMAEEKAKEKGKGREKETEMEDDGAQELVDEADGGYESDVPMMRLRGKGKGKGKGKGREQVQAKGKGKGKAVAVAVEKSKGKRKRTMEDSEEEEEQERSSRYPTRRRFRVASEDSEAGDLVSFVDFSCILASFSCHYTSFSHLRFPLHPAPSLHPPGLS